MVDNNSKGDATRSISEAFSATYVKEIKPGTSAARNRALYAASGEILAFTDDDCEVNAGWIAAIAEGFRDPTVVCVTGRAESPAGANWVQRQFESYSRLFCRQSSFLLDAQIVGDSFSKAFAGVAANMACRREVLRKLGGFPEALGSSEEDYIFFKLVHAGYRIRYDRKSLVFQHHRARLGRHLSRFRDYGRDEIRVICCLSGELQSGRFLLRNTLCQLKNVAWRVAASIAQGRFTHVLFGASQLAGTISVLARPWICLTIWREAAAKQRACVQEAAVQLGQER